MVFGLLSDSEGVKPQPSNIDGGQSKSLEKILNVL
jgi:hypothetical protein